MTIEIEKFYYHKKSFRLRSVRTDWEGVTESLNDRYNELLDSSFANALASRKYQIFMDLFSTCIKKYTPVKKSVNKEIHRNPVDWWDEKCEEMKRLRRAAFKKFDFSREEKDRIEYNKADAKLNRTIRRKRRSSYINFSESIDFKKNSKYVRDKMKIFKSKWAKTSIGNNSDTNEFFDKANEVLNKIAPLCVSSITKKLHNANNNHFFDKPFDFTELNLALEFRNKKSSSGLDGIDYFSFNKLPIKFKLILLDTFNEMYSSSDYPASWKKSFIHFIKKHDGSGLRPIAMTSCSCRIFELLLKNRLQWWCEHHGIIPPEQSGFRKGRSCIDNLTNLTLCIEDGFKNDRDTLAVFLDIQGAYDSVDPQTLLENLAEIGCSQQLINFAQHLTYERFITSAVNIDSPRRQ